jgi:pimeloyl-ACP methyl ester carboxylesterase
MKKIFIIPGFKQKPTDKYFIWLKKFLHSKNFDVVIVPINWNYKTMSDYIKEFEKFYNKHKSEENYILGFSYGAVITFITAERLKPKKIFLCSLSSDFKEDVPKMSNFIKQYIGKKRILDCLTRSGKSIAKELTIPTVIFYGEKEGKQYPQLKKRCEETAKISKNSKLIIVKNSPHDISHPDYMNAIRAEF